ncbi:arsenate reductase family protein [Flavimaricola marinus]|uniref:Regulatory protein Spx n=1 Tax=Flavimaricola marinus TaxID=1819565 RepID=A0A238LIF3_9RHOB|nr:ArsC/Spx/MgsR family protein [Flavimaricola marinus]SMY09469.1 Regulatory protein Spx [Flavimaricola marinus]
MILYGLPTCAQTALARKALDRAGTTYTFRDIRAEPLSEAEWQPLLHEFGDTLVDTSSQAYRNLNAWMRESEAEDQLAQHPAIMRRPVITDGTSWTIGWEPDARAVWGL